MKKIGLKAGDAKRVLAMIAALAEKYGEARTHVVEGGDSITIEVYTRPANFTAGTLVGTASVWIDGPYADDGACFASSPEIREVVGEFYPFHVKDSPRRSA